MSTIHVQALDQQTFEVTVGAPATTHVVIVRPAYVARLTPGGVDLETLVRESFAFLLEREPHTSILRRFDLSDIGRYFPEYEKIIGTRLGGAGR